MGLGKKTIDDQNYCGKKVLVRCDFNVPMKDGVITTRTASMLLCPPSRSWSTMAQRSFCAAIWASPRTAPRQSSVWHPLLRL